MPLSSNRWWSPSFFESLPETTMVREDGKRCIFHNDCIKLSDVFTCIFSFSKFANELTLVIEF